MKHYINILRAFILLVVFSFSYSHLYANHVIGESIGWEYLGNDQYKVITTLYRDCNGVAITNTAISFSGNCTGIKKISQTLSNGIDITPVCPKQCTRCQSSACSFQYGIEKYELITVLDVSTYKKNGCCALTLSWTLCCRNFPNSAQTGAIYVEAVMDLCVSPENNSPKFSHDPITFTCVGQNAIINSGAKDVDTNSAGQKSDSLFYSMINPLQGAGKGITWSSPYSHKKPLSYLGFPKDYSRSSFPYGFHFDSLTGDLMFRPMKIIQTIMAFKVEEYRNGKKIGEIIRDQIFVAIKCPSNNPPVISGFNCSTPIPDNFKITTCPGKKVCFDICATDKDTADSVKMTCNLDIKNANFKILNPGDQVEKGQFCWTPQKEDIRKEPYTFTIDVFDDACPLKGQASRTFQIFVTEPFELKTDIKPKSLCGDYQLSAYSTDSIANQEWKWYLNDSTLINTSTVEKNENSYTHKFDNNSSYPIKIQSTRSGCTVEALDTVKPNLIKPIILKVADTTLCESNRFKYTFNTKGGYGKLSYQWQIPSDSITGTSNVINTTFPTPSDPAGTKRMVYYQITDSAKCTASDSFQIWYKFKQALRIQQDSTFCGDLAIKKLPVHSPSSVGTWTGTSVKNNNFFPKFLSNGSYNITYFSEDTNQCYTDTAVFTIASKTPLDLGNDVNACPKMDHVIQLKAKPGGGTWLGKYVDSQGKYAASNNSIGVHNATYTFTNSKGCTSIDSIKVNTLNYQPFIDAGKDTIACINEAKMQLGGTPTGGIWSGNYVTNNGGYFYDATKTIIDDIYVLHYSISDSIGCVNMDSFKVQTQGIKSISAQDVSHCLEGSSDTITLLASPAGGVWQGKSLFGASGELILDSSFIGTNTYTYSLPNSNGCVSNKNIAVIIRENPQVSAGLDDTLCISQELEYVFKPNVTGGIWNGPELDVNNTSAKLSNKLNGTNHYTYTYTDPYGCSNSDDLTLFVGNESKADFVPSKTTGVAPLVVDFSNKSVNSDFYYWNFGNGLTSQAFEPSTTYIQEGEYDVTLIVVDSLGFCQTQAARTIEVKHNVSVNSLPEGSVLVYPNPAHSYIFLENQSENEVTFILYNALGKEVKRTNFNSQTQVQIDEFSAGIYTFQLIDAQGRKFQNQLVIE